MKAFDIFLFPSHWEGFGLVLVEAMLTGTPVVACRASNLPEIVTDGVEGRLVEIRSPELLADTIVELARASELGKRMGEAGRRRVLRDYTVEQMLDRHEVLLQRLIRNP
jgi:L-malate glycosyltransferase